MQSRTHWTLFPILALFWTLLLPKLWAADTLEIDKAFIGANDSWRDVTQFMQDQIDNGALSVDIAQPFTQVGGDPAPGKVKNLIVDYRLNGRAYRLCLKEQFPTAFEVSIPSPEAETPGANPDVTLLMDNISSFLNHAGPSRLLVQPARDNTFLVSTAIAISLTALGVSIFALAQVRRIRKLSNTGAPGPLP